MCARSRNKAIVTQRLQQLLLVRDEMQSVVITNDLQFSVPKVNVIQIGVSSETHVIRPPLYHYLGKLPKLPA